MGHYAKVINGLVVDIIVADQEWLDEQRDKKIWYVNWVQTSYNIRGGVYYDCNTNEPYADQSIIELENGRKRQNFASIGFNYDSERNAFIPPTPFPSWILNEDTCLWGPPIPVPEDSVGLNGNKKYEWNEPKKEWTYTGYYFEDGELKIEGQ